ncbi:hypothetical protein LIER_21291 [Lithospermum erythrorhizon]|uniref:Protein FAR1-RELATED SEQUENCE n=1 Tax=Lithospermum erythrorhizon TaxID=34254 RepID=A0AAV3QQW8_LITER
MSEEENDITHNYVDALVSLTEENEDSSKEIFEPFVGKCFLSEEETYVFYHQYAKQKGFSIRKGRFIIKNERKVRRDFFCHGQGSRDTKFFHSSKEQRNRKSHRCQCKAHMRITLKKSAEIFLEEWHVTKFVDLHNHNLLSSEEVRFLPMIEEEDEKCILLLKEACLSIRQIMRVLELEKKVKHAYLPFLSKNLSSYFDCLFRENAKNGAMDFVQHCFQAKFGDVVVFDTTYTINAYDMPFGIFIGMDYYGKTILFGCALLRDEMRVIFQWIMKLYRLDSIEEFENQWPLLMSNWMEINMSMGYTKLSNFGYWYTCVASLVV